LATLDCRKGRFPQALEELEAALDTNRQNNKAQVLKAVVLRTLGKYSAEGLNALLETDPLDHWARFELGDLSGFLEKSRNDAQTILDIAYDYADAGFFNKAIELLELHHANGVAPVAFPNPLEKSQLTHYALAWLQDRAGMDAGFRTLKKARAMSPDYFFPSRLHDQLVLEWALGQDGEDRNAAFGLGNYLFDRKRHEDAIAAWEAARRADPSFPTVCRNLGIAYWNVRRDGEAARAAYLQALENDPADSRIFYERDQLCKKLDDPVEERLAALQAHPNLVAERDDCTVELAALYNQTGRSEQALELVLGRRFHPWEGGEGQVLRQYTTARLQLGQAALEAGDADTALKHFRLAMDTPDNLGEAYHLLQAKADVNYWIGKALRALGQDAEAEECFEASASECGDFQAMAVTEHSELSYFRGLALIELGRASEAKAFFEDLKSYSERELAAKSEIDYFATSLPLLLVFEDDLDRCKALEFGRLLELAERGLSCV
jgi:tetratricopeptide (TPR) repeat protein